MVIRIGYHRNAIGLDSIRTEEFIKGETFSEVLEKLCENWVIEPQFGILTEIGAASPAIPKPGALIFCALAPHPVMNINFTNEQEVRALFDGLFKSVAIGDNSNYKPMFRVDRVGQTQFSTLFLVNALYHINGRNMDEVRRCFEGDNNHSETCKGNWYVFD